MSYILEALKKSQQERSRGQVPDIQTLHQAVVSNEPIAPRWPYWALGVCLMALAFLLGWLRPWDNRESVVTGVVTESAAVQRLQPELLATHSAQTTQRKPAELLATPVMHQDRVRDAHGNQQPLDISDLPPLVQQSIPQLQFAGHVYSSNPLQRSVIINGRYMSEGDDLMAGMKLMQITEDSVVFDYQGQQFKVTVLHDWTFQ